MQPILNFVSFLLDRFGIKPTLGELCPRLAQRPSKKNTEDQKLVQDEYTSDKSNFIKLYLCKLLITNSIIGSDSPSFVQVPVFVREHEYYLKRTLKPKKWLKNSFITAFTLKYSGPIKYHII